MEFEGGYFSGNNGEPINLGVNYIAGYRFNNTLFVGGGLGAGYYADWDGWRYGGKDFVNLHCDDYYLPSPDCSASLRYGRMTETGLQTIDGVYVQAFANVKIYLSKRRVQPFFDLSVGGFFANETKYIGTTYWDGYNDDWCDNPAHESRYPNHGSRTYDAYKDEKLLGLMLMPQFGLNFRLRQKLSLYFNDGYKFLPLHETIGCPIMKAGMAF